MSLLSADTASSSRRASALNRAHSLVSDGTLGTANLLTHSSDVPLAPQKRRRRKKKARQSASNQLREKNGHASSAHDDASQQERSTSSDFNDSESLDNFLQYDSTNAFNASRSFSLGHL